jgi:neutral ceramidase
MYRRLHVPFMFQADVVVGFFASNLGDVSPNLRGARCEFSGVECDNQFLLCAAGERCYSLGPGDDMFESTRIIGTAVYEGAVVSTLYITDP